MSCGSVGHSPELLFRCSRMNSVEIPSVKRSLEFGSSNLDSTLVSPVATARGHLQLGSPLLYFFVDQSSSNCCRCMSVVEYRSVVCVIRIHPRRTRDKTRHRSRRHRALDSPRSTPTRHSRPLHHLHHERGTIVWGRSVRLDHVAGIAIIGSIILGRTRI